MIKSMTGYGRKEAVLEGKKIQAEIKSVNHRFSDYSIRLPRHLLFLEDKVRRFASQYITRGKIDIFISVENYEEADKDIILNKGLAQSYLNALYELRDTFMLADDISVMKVAKYAEIFKTERKEEDEDAVWEAVKKVLAQAVGDFMEMRRREGERIYKDLKNRVQYMQSLAKRIEEREPRIVEEYKKRLYDKIKEVLEEKDIDEARILTEVAVYADKVAINEETVRLASHFDEYYTILEADEPAGRKLDFLMQEINREINTIGSKANDLEVARLVVDLKAELEKMREQIQNIE